MRHRTSRRLSLRTVLGVGATAILLASGLGALVGTAPAGAATGSAILTPVCSGPTLTAIDMRLAFTGLKSTGSSSGYSFQTTIPARWVRPIPVTESKGTINQHLVVTWDTAAYPVAPSNIVYWTLTGPGTSGQSDVLFGGASASLACSTAATSRPTTSAPPSTTSSAAGTCRQVLFVGVRGSGEKSTDRGGYGKDVDTIRQALRSALPGSVSYREVALDYSATAITAALTTPEGQAAFFASVDDGVTKLTNILNASAQNCTGAQAEKWVVAGFSQGALVVNQVIRSFPATRFAQVDLIADPARVTGQTTLNIGTAPPNNGLYLLADPTIGRLDASFTSNTVSLCDYGDLICDPADVVLPADLAQSANIHSSYSTRRTSLLSQMGVRAASGTGFGPRAAGAPVLSASGGTQQGSTVPVGGIMQPTISGLLPNQLVQIAVASVPIDLGSVKADPAGNLVYKFTVPATLPPGSHHLLFMTGSGNVSVAFTVPGAATSAAAASSLVPTVEPSPTASVDAPVATVAATPSHKGGVDSFFWIVILVGLFVVALVIGIVVVVQRRQLDA